MSYQDYNCKHNINKKGGLDVKEISFVFYVGLYDIVF